MSIRGKYILHKENPTSFKKGIVPWNKGKGEPLEKDIECRICHRIFHCVRTKHIRSNGYACWNPFPTVCSKECRYKACSIKQKKLKLKKECIVCGNKFEIHLAWAKKSGYRGYYCSRKCRRSRTIQYPEEVKKFARMLIYAMLAQGTIQQRPCEICENPKSQAHHYKGYAPENWTEVKWLCKKHHAEEHARLARTGESLLL